MDMTTLVTKLNSGEATISAMLDAQGLQLSDVNDSMLMRLGEAIHGGGLATSSTKLAAKPKQKAAIVPASAPASVVQQNSVVLGEQVDVQNIGVADTDAADLHEVLALAGRLSPTAQCQLKLEMAEMFALQTEAAYAAQGISIDSLCADFAAKHFPTRAAMPSMQERMIQNMAKQKGWGETEIAAMRVNMGV